MKGSYRLSGAASTDIVNIYKFGINTFGSESASRYVQSLEACIQELAVRKELARDASMFAKGLKYYRYKSHVIFYIQENPREVFVIRILGKRMDFIQHL